MEVIVSCARPWLRQRVRQRTPQALRLFRHDHPAQLQREAAPDHVAPTRRSLLEAARHERESAFAIVQHFDYYNNKAWEFGQQAFGPSLFSRFKLSDTVSGYGWTGRL